MCDGSDVGGRFEEARAAYDWFQADASCRRILGNVVRRAGDSRFIGGLQSCAYIAVGVWQWWTLTADSTLPAAMWPFVRRALDFVVDLGGERRHLVGSVAGGDTTTIRCSLVLPRPIRHCDADWRSLNYSANQPEWELRRGDSSMPWQRTEAFMDKSNFSMDWYYPVLGGALHGQGHPTCWLAVGQVHHRRVWRSLVWRIGRG